MIFIFYIHKNSLAFYWIGMEGDRTRRGCEHVGNVLTLRRFATRTGRVVCECVGVHHQPIGRRQCDQIGRFLKVFGDKISSKSSQNYSNSLGYFEKSHSNVKTYLATSWMTFGNIWATFYSNIWSHWSSMMMRMMMCTKCLRQTGEPTPLLHLAVDAVEDVVLLLRWMHSPLSLSLTHTHTHWLTDKFSQTYSYNSLVGKVKLSFFLSLSLSHTPSHPQTLTHTHTLWYIITNFHKHIPTIL